MEDFLVYSLTYNVATRFPGPGDDFRPILGLDTSSSSTSTYVKIPDMYIIALQEVKAQPQNMVWDTLFDDPWTAKVKDALAPFSFVKIHTLRMQGLVTSLYLKRSHLVYLRDVETLWTRRGFGGMWGNKGAVSIRLVLHGCSLCIVNCHLTPHDHMLKERISDYQEILHGQTFSYQETSNILFHDYVFWMGDFNFRLNGNTTSDEIVDGVSNGKCSELLKEDQLLQVRMSGEAFSELHELPITFPPTYKFETGVDNYDSKRRPAWTDRILYHVNASAYDNVTLKVEGNNYKAHMPFRCSDHRPVTASFQIRVFRPTTLKLVDFVNVPLWYTGESNKVFFKVVPTLETSPDDWIAIFKADFTSIDDYVAYVYATLPHIDAEEEGRVSTDESSGERSVTFSENSINFDGSYVLMYFAHASRSIYGMSNVFESASRGLAAGTHLCSIMFVKF
ncbi:phosphatidylinositol 4,5-bisphosphate 5-phosphatase A isoform X7 [Folsomia candida]|uniref:phosphatidylinositol 4,5-bisphosphate 5-phosphatase A isoform X7 n=1 Tax=Folsomia candida TaxID=158441 RepID=UPI00160549D9|nr:phosphatidylinositol 4,5-bisphosphate 5-phosphatase A isoform X7 [Folsomia candida]